MDTILSVQNLNFSGDGKEFSNVSRADSQTESHLLKQFLGVWNHGIIVHLRLTVPKHVVAKRAAHRIKEGTFALLLQFGFDENGGLVLRNVAAICEMFKTSWQVGKHIAKGELENQFKDQ